VRQQTVEDGKVLCMLRLIVALKLLTVIVAYILICCITTPPLRLHSTTMECLLGIAFQDFVLIAADMTNAQSIMVMKNGKYH